MNDENIKCIETFLMDIEILDKINAKISKFNAFETLGIVNNEIRHSNMLAWLFNPNDNHGLDDIFLKKFIQKIMYKTKNKFLDKQDTLKLVEISLMDYHDFIVKREYKNIDLLIYSEKNKFALVIENKIWSKESEHQLNKYKKIIEDEFFDYKKVYIFLTPNGDIPSDEEFWNIIDYKFIIDILEIALNLKCEEIALPVKSFLEQYIVMLRRHIVKNSELEKICVDIYLKHKKALDLIFEYKPDIYQDISNYIQGLLKEQDCVYLDDSSKMIIRFSTTTFDDKVPKLASKWTKSSRILLYEIQQGKSGLKIKLYIGPSDNNDIREKLFDVYNSNKKIFNEKKDKLNLKWICIYSKELMKKDYIEQYEGDYEVIIKIVEKELKKFFIGDFIHINQVYDEFSFTTVN